MSRSDGVSNLTPAKCMYCMLIRESSHSLLQWSALACKVGLLESVTRYCHRLVAVSVMLPAFCGLFSDAYSMFATANRR